MATGISPVSIPGGVHLKGRDHWSNKSCFYGNTTALTNQRSSNQQRTHQKLSVRVEYSDCSGGGGGDFVGGFLLGGALCGTIAYIFAPQVIMQLSFKLEYVVGTITIMALQIYVMRSARKIRRSLLNEDEYGFRRAKRPIYYDEGLEKTRQTLNAKISQLNSAIDNVSSRLRGGNNMPQVPVETDPEEATM